MYFLQPDSVLSMAFANLCPSVTVECGRATERSGILHARVHQQRAMPIAARNEFGKDVAERYFDTRNGYLCTRVPVMPSMLTLNVEVVKQDCLCYLMERLDLGKTLST